MAKKGKSSVPTLLMIVVGLLVVAGLIKVVSAGQGPGPGTSEGTLEVSETSWDFGTVSMKDGIATKEIELSNPSASPVTITRMETSCMCTEATIVRADGSRGATKGMQGHGGTPYLTEEIPPGGHVTIEVAFDPNAHGPNAVGPIRRTVSIGTDSTSEPTITLNFSGLVVK